MIDFPTSPSDGDNFASGNVTYIYSEAKDIWYTQSNINTLTINTSHVPESGNLYFTNERVYANVSPLLTTTTVSEGTNLYFTNTRAIEALTAGESLTIDSNGLVTVSVSEVDLGSVSQNIIPSTNEVYSLGSTENRWKDLFLSGNTIVLGNVAIKAANGSIATAAVEGNGYVVPQEVAIAGGGGYDLETDSTGFFALPVGTTEERPASNSIGYVRFNSTDDGLEFYTANSGWIGMKSLTISSVTPTSYPGNSGAQFTVYGSGFDQNIGVKFVTSAALEYNAGSIAINSPTQLTITSPRDFTVSDEPLSIKLTAPSGYSVTLSNAIDCGSSPTWSNTAGLLGNSFVDTTISPITLVATDPDGQSVEYSITSGSLPPGLVLTSSNGTITGTVAGNGYVTSQVTHNFDVTASDGINDTARSFSFIRKWYDGSSESLATASANLLYGYGITEDGIYWIDVLGTPTQIYCDMTNGGWMLYSSFANDNSLDAVNYPAINGNRILVSQLATYGYSGVYSDIADGVVSGFSYTRRSQYLALYESGSALGVLDMNSWKSSNNVSYIRTTWGDGATDLVSTDLRIYTNDVLRRQIAGGNETVNVPFDPTGSTPLVRWREGGIVGVSTVWCT